MRELDKEVIEILADENQLESFIERHEAFILAKASRGAGRYITKSDDEWMIALDAFYKAIRKYDYSKGSFISFAELTIQRSMIDYYRSQKKFNNETPVDILDEQSSSENNSDDIRSEIQIISQVLHSYGFSFMDLVDASPKAKKTKKSCLLAVAYIVDQPILYLEMGKTKQLPIKQLVKKFSIPRKTFERHRKYIIAVVEILHGDYPCLAEYFKHMGKEVRR